MRLRLLLSGGGTGGHIYPALAIAALVQQQHPGTELLYIGSQQGLEASLVPATGIAFTAVQAQGLVGKRPKQVVRALKALVVGARMARQHIRRFKPNLALGTGGYVSAPVMFAAWRQGVPVIIHEQNAIPGVANRWLSRLATAVATPYPDMDRFFAPGRRIVTTGNPVRSEILTMTSTEGRQRLGLAPALPVVLIFGGSRGAQSINDAALALVQDQVWGPGLPAQIVWITGAAYEAQVQYALQAKNLTPERLRARNVFVFTYVHEMAWALAAADLVVARAGATAIAEMSARGLPMILVPSPNVTHDHQTHNAARIVQAGAAVVVQDQVLTGSQLSMQINELLAAPQRRAQMSAAGQALGQAEAGQRLLTLIKETVNQRRFGQYR